MKKLFTSILWAACLSASAWGQSQPKTAAELAKYAGPDRERILYEGAKREGKVVWYTSLTIYKEIAASFEAKYPGVKIEPYRTASTTLATKILGETQARRFIADAIETTPGALMLLRDNKVLLPYTSPHLGNYPEGAKDKASGGLVFSTVDRESYAGIGYNKTAVRDGDVPRSFDDLLKPALKGKMAVTGEEMGARVIGAMLKAKGDGFLKKLAGQDVKVYGIPALGLNELVVSGEVPLTFSAVDSNVRVAAMRGAPVAWVPPDLVVTNAGSAAVYAPAPHPHAALLFVEFMISPEGQKIFGEKYGYGTPGKEPGFKRWYPEQGLTIYEYADTIEKWNKLLSQMGRR
jgi:iron(III) transport system substrate-binding protein